MAKKYVATVYRNLNKKCWSVKYRGKTYHFDHFSLDFGWCHVAKNQQAKARRLKQRNVHASIKAKLTPEEFIDAVCKPQLEELFRSEWYGIKYTPFSQFFDTFYYQFPWNDCRGPRREIAGASDILFRNDGNVVARTVHLMLTNKKQPVNINMP